VKLGRLQTVLLLALAAALASCLAPPAPHPESAANPPTTPTAAKASGGGCPEGMFCTGSRPAPAEAWAGDGECLASAPAGGGDEMRTDATDLIIRTVQRSDPRYQLLAVHVAVDSTVLGPSERAARAGVQAPDQFVRVPGVTAGPHVVSVVYLLQGNGTGEYAYLRGYKYKVRSSHAFTVAPGQTTCISILLYFDPDLERSANERPNVDYREERAPLGVKGEGSAS
jgi:hypothetical protein